MEAASYRRRRGGKYSQPLIAKNNFVLDYLVGGSFAK